MCEGYIEGKLAKNIKVEDFQSIFGAMHFKLILQEKSILK